MVLALYLDATKNIQKKGRKQAAAQKHTGK
jgi:hypothetical protein